MDSLLDFFSYVNRALSDVSNEEQTLLVNFEKYISRIDAKLVDDYKNASYLKFPKKLVNCHSSLEAIALKLCTASSDDLNNALKQAVLLDLLIFVALLIRLGANVRSIHSSRKRGLLHYCLSGDMVNLLIWYGADVYQKSNSGDSALHSVRCTSVAEALLENGLSVHLKNNAGSTVLYGNMDLSLVRYFLKKGANPNCTNIYGHSPMHLIATQGNWEVIYVLLMAGCDPTIVGRDGRTAVALASDVKTLVLLKNPNDTVGFSSLEIRRMDQTIELLSRLVKYIMNTHKHLYQSFTVLCI